MLSKSSSSQIRAPIIALDLGEKRVGVALCDALAISIKPIAAIGRTSWKQLLAEVRILVQRFDAQTMVIGLPLSLDGAERDAAAGARSTAKKFAQSLDIPVYLQDERLSSVAARENLAADRVAGSDLAARLDSESAAVILKDFLVEGQDRHLVEATSRDT